jgi:hypothetical protein
MIAALRQRTFLRRVWNWIMKLRAKSSITLTVAFGLMATAAFVSHSSIAVAHSGTAEEQAACTPDVFRLCFFEIPNEERIVACLNSKLSQLSPACHDVMAGPPAKKKMRDAR